MFKPIVSEKQAICLLRRQLKYLFNKQQRYNGDFRVNYESLLAIKVGNLYSFVLLKKRNNRKAHKVLIIRRSPDFVQ